MVGANEEWRVYLKGVIIGQERKKKELKIMVFIQNVKGKLTSLTK